MTGEVDAVFFDAGGTLWDMRPSVADLFAAELAGRGVEADRADLDSATRAADMLLDDRFAGLAGGDETPFWEEYDDIVLDRLRVDVDRTGFAKALSGRMRETAGKVESWVAYPDAAPALRAVRGRGLKVGLISNASELARRVLRNLGMEPSFDIVVISDEVGVRKPDPRIFRLALERAGTPASRALYVGDRPATDIRGAMRAGMKGVLVDRRGAYPRSGLPTIASLDELGLFM